MIYIEATAHSHRSAYDAGARSVEWLRQTFGVNRGAKTALGTFEGVVLVEAGEGEGYTPFFLFAGEGGHQQYSREAVERRLGCTSAPAADKAGRG